VGIGIVLTPVDQFFKQRKRIVVVFLLKQLFGSVKCGGNLGDGNSGRNGKQGSHCRPTIKIDHKERKGFGTNRFKPATKVLEAHFRFEQKNPKKLHVLERENRKLQNQVGQTGSFARAGHLNQAST
jgi:hypothetical protein